jgi:hypothetical protein
LAVGGAFSAQAQIDVTVNGTPGAVGLYQDEAYPSTYQTPTYGSNTGAEFAVAAVAVPEASDYSWLGASLLMVCGLASTASRSNRYN